MLTKILYPLVVVLSLLLSSVVTLAYAENSRSLKLADADEPKTIMVVGDSLSTTHYLPQRQRWITQFQQQIKASNRDNKVVNLSQDNQTAYRAAQRFEWHLNQINPDVVVLEVGSADYRKGYTSQFVAEQLKQMVDMALSRDIQVVLVGLSLPPSRMGTSSLRSIYVDIANQYDVTLIDVDMSEYNGVAILNTHDLPMMYAEAQLVVSLGVWNAIGDGVLSQSTASTQP